MTFVVGVIAEHVINQEILRGFRCLNSSQLTGINMIDKANCANDDATVPVATYDYSTCMHGHMNNISQNIDFFLYLM
jgi:hypothetical protein